MDSGLKWSLIMMTSTSVEILLEEATTTWGVGLLLELDDVVIAAVAGTSKMLTKVTCALSEDK